MEEQCGKVAVCLNVIDFRMIDVLDGIWEQCNLPNQLITNADSTAYINTLRDKLGNTHKWLTPSYLVDFYRLERVRF